jgi:hypothetical protein
MLVIKDEPHNIEYHIRNISLEDADKLRLNGQVFYDFTKLTAINTCPTFGVLRYALHRTDYPLTSGGRRLAVECGSACHDFFAALRLWTLIEEHIKTSKLKMPTPFYDKAVSLFGTERFDEMLAVPQDSDRVNNAQLFALSALHTSGYYDDPSDRKRTMSNMETACLAYADRYLASDKPVLVRDGIIGIEIPFVLEVKAVRPWKDHPVFDTYEQTAYYCGRIDGIHQYGSHAIVGENKTAAQLSQSWKNSFAISHQVTGYTIAGTCILNEDVFNAEVMGTQIPLPRDAYNGVVFQPESRTESDRLRWCEWFFQGIATYESYVSRPHEAPRYSHSCNRYFSACEFIPFCSLTREEQTDAVESMRIEEWSPLNHLQEKEV